MIITELSLLVRELPDGHEPSEGGTRPLRDSGKATRPGVAWRRRCPNSPHDAVRQCPDSPTSCLKSGRTSWPARAGDAPRERTRRDTDAHSTRPSSLLASQPEPGNH